MTRLSTLTLEKLDALDNFQDEPCNLQIDHESTTLRCDFQSCDRMSCSLVELHLQRAPDHGLDRLQQRADRLCRRVTYLLEPLNVIEADPPGGRVLLRSSKPQCDGDSRNYYELLLDATGALRLRRYCFDRSEKAHRSLPFQLTKEVLAKLIDDLAEVVV